MLSRVIHILSKQELYFLCGDTVKVGDWVYNLISKEISEEYDLGNYIESVIIDSIEDGSIRTAKVKFVTEGNTTTGRFDLPKSIPIVDPKTNTITFSYTKRFTF
jgi:hypothetical protein